MVRGARLPLRRLDPATPHRIHFRRRRQLRGRAVRLEIPGGAMAATRRGHRARERSGSAGRALGRTHSGRRRLRSASRARLGGTGARGRAGESGGPPLARPRRLARRISTRRFPAHRLGGLLELRFDRFYRYADLTAILHGFARRDPGLFAIESIGKSHEGRDIWVVTATRAASGPAVDKPAFWIDGNIHAAELTASTPCRYSLHTLEQGYGKNAEITRLLDTRALYVCPRINPDVAEWALADKPKYIRSSTRPYPFDEDPVDGLTVEDIDGDGRILSMRIPDPNGAFKAHPDDARLMTPREPAEYGGEYWRVIPEGTLVNFDGVEIRVNRDKQGIDLNRNFPSGWRQEFQQVGAGPYPTSEPEVRSVVDFIVKHPNIGAGVSFHTHSGVILRPFASEPDDNMPAEDLWLYKLFGNKSTELKGYPNISIFHDFN